MSAQQPAWKQPTRQSDAPVLKLYNSLTRSKTEFVPSNGNHVKWYNCGPTVYDASHMGHARNYVSQDILRRIMSDYFGYDVQFVMNVTDIDDKIIITARKNYLLEGLRKETQVLSTDLIAQTRAAWNAHIHNNVSKGLPDGSKPQVGVEDVFWAEISKQIQDPKWKQECLGREEKFEMFVASASKSKAAIETAEKLLAEGITSREVALELIDGAKDVLADALDKELHATVTDPAISAGLASFWEKKFFEDMARLRVRDPDTVTRVTEYVPEVVSFVEQIISNGYAYELDGNVYFDTKAFDGKNAHHYAKLQPWSKDNKRMVQDGEGSLSVSKSACKSTSDFALWKTSKAGEPAWPSPWGPGRPGWHIECSVMASAILGDNIDIHSGGIDLAFPHHDNELAQSEAYHECGAWVNYFLHTGHLHIEGLKMSKSLKNFITIDEILQRFTARQLRLGFLTQLWSSKVDFTESLMTGEVKTLETTFNNFFTVVKALSSQFRDQEPRSDKPYHYYEDLERSLAASLIESKTAFRTALCDSFNTPVAIDVLKDIVSRANVYINGRGKALNVRVVENVAQWVGDMLCMFGLGEGSSVGVIGWGQEDSEQGGANRETILMPYLRTLSTFRDGVRKIAIEKGDKALSDILALSDKLRDEDLVTLGVALDDQEDGKALVKLVPPADLIKARDEKRAIAEAKAAKKAENAKAEQLKKLQRLERGRVSPTEMFRTPNVPEGTYKSWDETGIPLTDGEGKELSKGQVKKVAKEWAAQKKLHEEYLGWKGSSTTEN